MTLSEMLVEIIDELFEELFGTESNPLYGKFIDTDGVYELENGNLIKVINNGTPNVRSKRAEKRGK